MPKTAVFIGVLLLTIALLPLAGDASQGFFITLDDHPMPVLQWTRGFEVTYSRAGHRLGDMISLSSSIPTAQATISVFNGFRLSQEGPDHVFWLFRPVEVRMPSIEELFARYGYNRYVRRLISYYTREREAFAERLKRAGRYIDEIARIFVEHGIPPELSYLPLIESGFKTHAYSPKRAAGLWQFIPATAKKYGLKIDWWVDERRDPVKSTIAAARYLKDLYIRYRDWNLALAAYNAGEGVIDRAIRMMGKKDYWWIRRTKFINRETKNYVPSFIAATAIALEPERFGFLGMKTYKPLRYETVEVNTPIDLAVVARFTDSTLSEIKELNPELRRWCTPPNVSAYTLRIPAGTKETFLARLSSADEEDLFYVKLHKVRPGDTVSKIARQLGTSIQAIIELNSLGKDAMIIAGRTILVPVDRGIHEFRDTPEGIRPIIKAKGL